MSYAIFSDVPKVQSESSKAKEQGGEKWERGDR